MLAKEHVKLFPYLCLKSLQLQVLTRVSNAICDIYFWACYPTLSYQTSAKAGKLEEKHKEDL